MVNTNDGFLMYGGQAGTIFNDIRKLHCINNEMTWSCLKKDEHTREVQARFAHCCGSFGKYLVTFGGFGEKNKRT